MYALEPHTLRCPTTGKHAYVNRRRAEHVLREAATRRHDGRPIPTRAYRCPDCKWFHLTSRR